MAMLRLLGVALVALLALPLAAAAPAEGRLEVEGALALRGAATLRAPAADLLWNATGAPTLVLEADALHVERYGRTTTVQKTPLGPGVTVSDGQISDRADHADARVTLTPGQDAQQVVLRTLGEARVDATDVDLAAVESVQLFRAGSLGRTGCRVALHCADAFGVYAARAATSDATLSGDLTLYLYGPTLVVSSGGAEATYASGSIRRESGTMTIHEDAWLIVTAKGATATVQAAGPAQWFSASPRLEARELVLPEGTGALSVGGRTYHAQAERVDAKGTLVLQPETLEAPRAILADGSRRVDAPRFATHVSGDVSAINLRAVPVYADGTAEAVSVVAIVGAILGGLAWYWPHVSFHATSAALPLYTRLKRPEILDNDVRNAIYDIIRSNPGISARAVQRESDLSWGTVVYHLRQLERHHLVVSRALGRTRNYYENHGKYKGMEVQLACLQSPRALTLARLVHQQPGATQEALAQASGYPQPTTSYYVRKLRHAALIEEQREGRYTRYLPGPELERFLALAEASPAPPAETDAPRPAA